MRGGGNLQGAGLVKGKAGGGAFSIKGGTGSRWGRGGGEVESSGEAG